MVKMYKTKPCEIEAIKWNGMNFKEIKKFTNGKAYMELVSDLNLALVINTLEGDMVASTGDYIIKGLRGEFYPCKPDVFRKKYELIKEVIECK